MNRNPGPVSVILLCHHIRAHIPFFFFTSSLFGFHDSDTDPSSSLFAPTLMVAYILFPFLVFSCIITNTSPVFFIQRSSPPAATAPTVRKAKKKKEEVLHFQQLVLDSRNVKHISGSVPLKAPRRMKGKYHPLDGEAFLRRSSAAEVWV